MLGSPCSPCCNPCNAYTPWPEIRFAVGWPNLFGSWIPSSGPACAFSSPGPQLNLPQPYALGPAPGNGALQAVASLVSTSGGMYQFLYQSTADSGIGQIACDQSAYTAWANKNGNVNLLNPLFPPVVVAVKVSYYVRIELYPFGVGPPAGAFDQSEYGITNCGLLYYLAETSVVARWDHGLFSFHLCRLTPRGSSPRVSTIAPLWPAGPYGTNGAVDRTQYMVWRYNDTPSGSQKTIQAVDWSGQVPTSLGQYQLTDGSVPRDGGQIDIFDL